MKWLLLVYKVPSTPTRHRVAVWRDIRRIGALALQPSICALPNAVGNRRSLVKLAAMVEGIGGEASLLLAKGLDRSTTLRLESGYTKVIEEEFVELLDECRKFRKEVEKEIRMERFTLAELAEEEESFDRLERWLERLSTKDFFGAPSRTSAEIRIKECGALLERFAEKVLKAEES